MAVSLEDKTLIILLGGTVYSLQRETAEDTHSAKGRIPARRPLSFGAGKKRSLPFAIPKHVSTNTSSWSLPTQHETVQVKEHTQTLTAESSLEPKICIKVLTHGGHEPLRQTLVVLLTWFLWYLDETNISRTESQVGEYVESFVQEERLYLTIDTHVDVARWQ